MTADLPIAKAKLRYPMDVGTLDRESELTVLKFDVLNKVSPVPNENGIVPMPSMSTYEIEVPTAALVNADGTPGDLLTGDAEVADLEKNYTSVRAGGREFTLPGAALVLS